MSKVTEMKFYVLLKDTKYKYKLSKKTVEAFFTMLVK